MRNRLAIVIGVVLGILTAVMVRAYVLGREMDIKRQLLKGQEPTPVLVALRDVPASTILRDDMVGMENRPAFAIQPHTIYDPGDALGKMTVVPLYKGEQVSQSKLAQLGTIGGLSVKTPPGKRAITMAIDAITGVGGMVKPGDYIDLMGVFNVPGPSGGQPSAVTLTLLQRVELLAVGDRLSSFSEDEEEDGASRSATTVTLALTPQDAQLVLFARAAQGQLHLALRAPADSAMVANLTPTTLETLLGIILGPKAMELAQQNQAAALRQQRQVEVYRGLDREIVALSEQLPLPMLPAPMPAPAEPEEDTKAP